MPGPSSCALAALCEAVLKPMYANFLRNGHSHKEAGPFFNPFALPSLFRSGRLPVHGLVGQHRQGHDVQVRLLAARHLCQGASRGARPAFGVVFLGLTTAFTSSFWARCWSVTPTRGATSRRRARKELVDRKTLAQCLSDPYLESDSHRVGRPKSCYKDESIF